MTILQKFIGHTKTVYKHRKMVRKLCFQCGLYWQGLTHDLSKYSPVEFLNGVKYYTGTASPHVGERKDKGYSDAWLHHHNHNKHHIEYWQDIDPITGASCPIEVPEKYLKEMICDRVAASMTYLGDKYHNAAPLEYYEAHKHENRWHENTRTQVELYLNCVAIIGFEKTMNAKGNN